MQDKAKLVPEKIHIEEFFITKGQLNSPEGFDLINVDGHEWNAAFNLSFDLENKLIRAELTIDIKSRSKAKSNQEEASCEFTFVFIFKVENIHELTELDNSKIVVLKGGLGNALSSISYSTARGILISRLQGTSLQDFMLPVINPNDLLKAIKKPKKTGKK